MKILSNQHWEYDNIAEGDSLGKSKFEEKNSGLLLAFDRDTAPDTVLATIIPNYQKTYQVPNKTSRYRTIGEAQKNRGTNSCTQSYTPGPTLCLYSLKSHTIRSLWLTCFSHCRVVDGKASHNISCGFQVLQQRKARHSMWELAVHIFFAQSPYLPTRETGP